MVLDPGAVGRTVEQRDPALLEDAAEALKEASTAIAEKDQAALSLLNRRFHRALHRGCGNPLLVSILDDLKDRAALISVVGWEANPSWKKEWNDHKAVLAAPKNGDARGAASLLPAHLGGFLEP